MLPWCRGAHPVFWSVVEDRPLGVTIHLIDQGLDTGNILIQQALEINLNAETFRSTYRHLSGAIENLFVNNWAHLRVWQDAGVKQRGGGSMHRASELEQWLEFMPKSWDTPISEFLVLAADRINAYHETFLN
jgi:methionyl-tRNA formyltransferase